MSKQIQALKQFIHFYGKEVTPAEFYRSIFPEGALSSASYQQQGKYACRLHYLHVQRPVQEIAVASFSDMFVPQLEIIT